MALVMSYGSFTYSAFAGWWLSSAGTALILLCSYLIWKKEFLKNIGLQLKVKTIINAVFLAAIIATCAFLLMSNIADKHNIAISYTNWRDYFHDIFYVLNEEIVLGSVLLFALVRKGKIHPVIASTGLAVLFALIHFVAYKWFFTEKGIIGMVTLVTLFLVGFIRNSLILQTGHIGYSWALHFGWIIVMFGSMHTDMNTNLRVAEPVRFNLYLGSVQLCLISLIAAFLILMYWIKKGRAPNTRRLSNGLGSKL